MTTTPDTGLDTSAEARHRRLRTALRTLKERDQKGGAYNTSHLDDANQRRQRTLMILSAAAVRQERMEGRYRS